MKWLRSIFQKKKHYHNLEISQNIGLLVVNKMVRDRKFRRTLERDYPQLSRQIEFQLRKIQ